MSSFRERNDPKHPKSKNRAQKFSGTVKAALRAQAGPAESGRKSQPNQKPKVGEEGWLWGVHAVEAALKNLSRPGPLKLFVTEDRARGLAPALLSRPGLRATTLMGPDIARLLPAGAVHQGMALHGPVLEGDALDALMEHPSPIGRDVILMLDQVTDPQNIGAILRSAAAFGVQGLVMQDRHSPPLQGVLAKTAAGAVDQVRFASVTNLSRALEALNEAGYISVGLAGEGAHNLHTLLEELEWGQSFRKLVLVLGSEGEGIRRLVAEHCDHLARIPMPGGFESLNVSHAASIALYESCART